MRALRRINWGGIAALFLGLLAWQAAVSLWAPGQTTVAAPLDIVAVLGDSRVLLNLWEATVHTAGAALSGWGLALIVGVALGVGVGYSRRAWNSSASTIDFLRALPPVALVAPLVLIFGFSVSMEIAVVFYGCVWPILMNTALGMRQVPEHMRAVCATLRMSAAQSITRVFVPWTAPMILVGARLALSLAVILAVVTEMVGNPQGIGYQFVYYQQALNPGALYLFIVVAGVLALVLNAALVAGAKLLRPIARRAA